jgi:hypothetical protein
MSLALAAPTLAATNYTVVGWNNLGMHCMDSDFSVFSILPPYNVAHAQLIAIINGNAAQLVTSGTGYIVTYEAIADADGSINTTAAGKGNFWDYAGVLFGTNLVMDQGLPIPIGSFYMPGTNNTPQTMPFETNDGFFGSPVNWFAAYGVPITPYDDAGRGNQYPLMRIRARNAAGVTLATTDIVLPVSDEMDCKLCHASGSGSAAMPAAGWVNDPDPGRDYRLNILRLHDQHRDPTRYPGLLQTLGLNTNGLFATVVVDHRPILCAMCHKSEALPGSGYGTLRPLTRNMHAKHATVIDPRTNPPLTLDDESNRTSCYACHPGSVTRCLRGAMGRAVAADGSMAMQCQSCHGNMSAVGASTRTGWVDEPNCQACHVGTATNSYGVIRFDSVFDAPGHMRVAAEQTFATNPDTPAAGASLYRFSKGHGGLQCSACHGSTHAEFPSAFRNDNREGEMLQGHAGVIIECQMCHGVQPANNQFHNGPHGMHPLRANWAGKHNDAMGEHNTAQCRACHGLNYEGTVLSRAQAARTFTVEKFGTKMYWRGQQISCYGCHDGPNSSNPTTKGFPTVANASATTASGVPVAIALTASTSNLRIVSQPAHGTVALNGTAATYYPEIGYAGSDRFTFAANNGYNDSPLATVSIQVFGSSADPVEPRIFGLRAQGSDIRFGFTSLLTQKYALETANALVPASWAFAKTLWGRTDSTPVSDAGALTQPRKFYRVRTTARPVAYDDASNSAYASGFANGSNAGTGFNAWQLTPAVSGDTAGFFIGDSTANGCYNDGVGICPPCGPGINVFGTAFGIYANSGATADAKRQFTAGGMIPGQSFSLDFDNGCLDGAGTKAGFALQNSTGENRFELFFNAGDSVYRIHDASGPSVATSVGFTQRGLHIEFTLTGPNTYTVSVTRMVDGVVATHTGTLAGTANSAVDRADFYYVNSSTGGSTRDVFFDRLELY